MFFYSGQVNGYGHKAKNKQTNKKQTKKPQEATYGLLSQKEKELIKQGKLKKKGRKQRRKTGTDLKIRW